MLGAEAPCHPIWYGIGCTRRAACPIWLSSGFTANFVAGPRVCLLALPRFGYFLGGLLLEAASMDATPSGWTRLLRRATLNFLRHRTALLVVPPAGWTANLLHKSTQVRRGLTMPRPPLVNCTVNARGRLLIGGRPTYDYLSRGNSIRWDRRGAYAPPRFIYQDAHYGLRVLCRRIRAITANQNTASFYIPEHPLGSR